MPYCSKCGEQEYYCKECGVLEECNCDETVSFTFSPHKCKPHFALVGLSKSDEYCPQCGGAYPEPEYCTFCGDDITPSHECYDFSSFSLTLSKYPPKTHKCS